MGPEFCMSNELLVEAVDLGPILGVVRLLDMTINLVWYYHLNSLLM